MEQLTSNSHVNVTYIRLTVAYTVLYAYTVVWATNNLLIRAKTFLKNAIALAHLLNIFLVLWQLRLRRLCEL